MDVKIGKYMHYKGIEHDVIGVARHSEDPKQEFVIYRHMNSNGINQMYARPIEIFFQDVEIDGKKVPRFVYIGE